MLKNELRKIYLAKRKSLSTDESADCAREISERFFNEFDLSKIKYLHIFLAIGRHNEIETSFIIKRLWNDFSEIKTCVPRVDKANDTLETIVYSPDSTIEVTSWGIPEVVGGETVEPKKIDAVIAPLLCFDKKGFRVGYGRGFYDKLLSRCRPDCQKIGLSYFAPVEEISDVESHDIGLDYCVTPEKIFSFTK